MSYEFALLPASQIKKPSIFSSLFSKKETANKTESSDAAREHRKQKVVVDYVALFQSRSEQDGFGYYENNSKKPAFSASKDRVTVHKLDDNAIRAGLQLAQSQFGEIRVDGPDDVRRQVWLQGLAIGIDVAGYEPNEKDRAAADKLRQSFVDAPAEAQISAASELINAVSDSPEPEPEQKEEPVAQPRQPDVLVEHGAEPYEFDEKNKMSYYAIVRDAVSGELKTHWGVDLERAISEVNAEAGDQVSFERLGRTKVKVTDPETQIVREVERQTWQVDVIEKAAVLAQKEAIAAARNVIGTDVQIYQARTDGGASEGPIIHINQRYAVQQIGDKSSAVIHDLKKLSGSASIGQNVDIQYKDGIGKVELFEKTQGRFAQLFAQEPEPEPEAEYEG
jgi:hypothetical protein